MRTDELNFDLPPELIAQSPAATRDEARLLHYQRATREISHRTFSDLPDLLSPGDLLVFNNTRVIPARFTLRKPTGGYVEGLFLNEVGCAETNTPSPCKQGEGRGDGSSSGSAYWRVMLKNFGSATRDGELRFEGADDTSARVVRQEPDGTYLIRIFSTNLPFPSTELLNRIGRMPLPPYIKRNKHADPRDAADRERYQTVYSADQAASIAAPTAGLHFTETLLRQLDERNIERASVTLHVGLGTFKPVSAERLEEHPMHEESWSIDGQAANAINRAVEQRRRIIAVGTTAARVLESHLPGQPFCSAAGQTRIFIYPPYEWRYVNAIITNFHLPRSTLIALVAARIGLEEQRRVYAEAIGKGYRFFSYGDASFLE